MPRKIKTDVLEQAARDWAGQFLLESRWSKADPKLATAGRDMVIQNLYNMRFKDEFNHLLPVLKDYLGSGTLNEFESLTKDVLVPRTEKSFLDELSSWLAIDPDGNHIPGTIGRVAVGGRLLGTHLVEVETIASIRYRKEMLAAGLQQDKSVRMTRMKQVKLVWPIYAGEEEERAAGSTLPDAFPKSSLPLINMALNTKISNECAILACDAVVDNLDEGSSNAVVNIYGDTQATDPDTAVGAQTLLSTHTCTDPCFGAAADAAPGGQATANAVADDTSADATDTATWFRASATNNGTTPFDDHIDGSVGTATADLIFNSVAFVSGANVAIDSWTITMPES